MPPAATSLAITNPLVLYRTLIATKKINPDPSQHRLAITLQRIYHRLLDYEPEVEYSYRIRQLRRTIRPVVPTTKADHDGSPMASGQRKGLFAAFRAQKEEVEAKALTRKLTDHQAAIELGSPQGLLLYGEVGTGKSMLVVCDYRAQRQSPVGNADFRMAGRIC